MFSRILAAVDDVRHGQAVLDLVRKLAVPGISEVHVVHIRVRELAGYRWYAPETRNEASFVAEAALFDLRMDGVAAGAQIRSAYVDRVAQAILAEAADFDADLIVLGPPSRGELLARLFGDTTLRMIRRSRYPVLVAPRRVSGPPREVSPGLSAPGRLS